MKESKGMKRAFTGVLVSADRDMETLVEETI